MVPGTTRRGVRRRLAWVVALVVAAVVMGNVAIAATSLVLGTVRPPAEVPAEVTGVPNLTVVDDRVWRGAAPGAEGFRSLAEAGVTTVVDLRAEEDAAHLDDGIAAIGVDVVRLPVRDGQLPTEEQISTFQQTVADADGTVFVHCGAGVGRTGAMAAAYLLRDGGVSPEAALARNLAVGPPSLEQIAFVVGEEGGADRPPAAIVAMSRVLDAPRRLWSRLG